MAEARQVVFWHRHLPPWRAEPAGEHVVEADSRQVEGTLSHKDELWSTCYEDLMVEALARLEQEVSRLGGHYAHVLSESIEVKRNDAAGVANLHGRFVYMLYRMSANG